ncbi:MAG: NADPH-dependent assimilatory sulfite reductase hemoprotein subunit [Sphingobacteriales bacterium]|nr:MAG: NADPH-dependent assimilatory sulfite reductase hemoprotein subunit [Sphingobacteriales bacterium]
MSIQKPLTVVERIKTASRGLRGTLSESLSDELTGAIREDDQTLIKFHGMYQQDDRDRREERTAKKLEWLYSFMIRLRLPGGYMTAEQWKALHHITGEHTTGVIKITTRQTVQLHGILKSYLRPTISAFDTVALDSIAACGDVNRNVTCSAHTSQSKVHAEVFAYADKISMMALPKTRAYYEIWLNDEALLEKAVEEDPLYQDRYLPRKFKIGIAIPPDNDVDVMSNDIGLIAIVENDHLLGFNIAVGGGLGTTHGNTSTYPRLATVIGFVSGEERILKAVYEVITIQRDYGDRTDRRMSRLKYTLDRMGIDVFKKELEHRIGFKLEKEKPFAFSQRKDHFGWQRNHEGLWYYTAFVETGRVTDDSKMKLKTALYEIAESGKAAFRFTCNQNIVVADVADADKAFVDEILQRYGVISFTESSGAMRRSAIACVAFNTCPLALAEAQRYLPSLIGKIEPLLAKHGLDKDDISIRMTGCPNGCGRPTMAEIGLIGTAYGKYNLHLGGDRLGLRLNQQYKSDLDEAAILEILDHALDAYVKERVDDESFGDYIYRRGLS